MKKVVAVAITLVMMSFSLSTQAGNSVIREKLKKVIKFENNKLPIAKHEEAFVKVSFKVGVAGKIQILESNYSHKEVKEILLGKLSDIRIEEIKNSDQIYYYNFVFRKS